MGIESFRQDGEAAPMVGGATGMGAATARLVSAGPKRKRLEDR